MVKAFLGGQILKITWLLFREDDQLNALGSIKTKNKKSVHNKTEELLLNVYLYLFTPSK